MKYHKDGDTEHQLDLMLNGGLDFNDNVSCAHIEFTSTGSEQEITHNLGNVPSGFIVLFISGEASIWGSRLEEWTTTKLYLNVSATNLKVRCIVL